MLNYKRGVTAIMRMDSKITATSAAMPTQLGWKTVEVTVDSLKDFVDGLYTVCGVGSSYLRHGFAIHILLLLFQEEYDTHDPKGYCSLTLPFLKKRSKIIEIVVARDIVFDLA